ncbi:MAG: autotransporter outer membrane beta-barrel domain-containing protein [Brevundimonas sp.]|uniref:autotransporter outer membrane beta-barrel domain-containing protein n=1 Tax=Brevundimonas sp. TaxID=1871086 RepID=UPI0040349A7D
MRKLLAAAAALAPLMVATGVQAEVVISNTRTTPIQTSNATGTAADAIRLASGGRIEVTSGAAVTVDSNHSVDLDSGSTITMNNSASGSTGILVNGGTTADITIGGAITVIDANAAATDTDGDGDLDGQFAAGSDRAGLRVVGAQPVTGSILMESGSSISVRGNDSYGILLQSGLIGDMKLFGSVTVTGDNSYGVRTTGPVSGSVLVSGGAISTNGANAVGVAVDGNVGGRVQIQGGVSTTGYRYTTAPTSGVGFTNVPKETLVLEDLDADDLLQNGPAVRIAANVAGGVLLGAAPATLVATGDDDGDGVKNGDEDDDGDGVKNSDDTDRDGDGILDASEGTSALTSIGGAPALQIGSTTSAVTVGVLGAGDLNYGLVNEGSITGTGVYADVDARAVQIGGRGQPTTIAGGIRNSGAITASANTADATAIELGAGATTPRFVNSGTVLAQSQTDNADTVTGVLIQAGASLPSITNTGTITAAVAGEAATAYAIRDLSGSLTSIVNQGGIYAAISATDGTTDTDDDDTDPANEVVTGKAIALDLRANTSGVSFVQSGAVGRTNLDTDGDGILDNTDTDDDNDGVLDGADTDDNDDDNDGVYDQDEPVLYGSILLGSGSDTVSLQNGTVIGDIAFGAGADALSISGGARYQGALSDTDGQLTIDVSKGTLDARQTTALNVTSLNVGSEGDLIVTVDPKNASSGGFIVSGNATLADGAGLGVNFASLIEGQQQFKIIDAATLNYGAVDLASINANSPYLFVVGITADVAAGDVYANARRRSAEEINLTGVEVSAYDAFYSALDDNSSILQAFLAQKERDGFINLYEQMLPDHSGGPLMSLASGVDAVTRALTGRNASAAEGETSAWVQEINFYADKDKTDTYGFRSEGFGVAGGVERGTGLGALGVSVAFTSSDIQDPEAEAEEVLSANLIELGLYWRAQGHNWTTWARAAGGYASFEAKRSLVGEGLYINNTSEWSGFTLALAGGASYERNFGRFNIRPEVYAEYFGLNEDSRVESGGGDGFDLEIDEREGHIFSTVAAVNFGYGFGTNGWIRPEVRLGWRQNLSVDAGETIGRFVNSNGPDFRLTPQAVEGGGLIAGFRLSVGNELGMLSINADAEQLEDYIRYTLLLRASFKF